MKRRIVIIATAIFLMAAYTGKIHAQTKAITSIWSFNALGIGYEHYIDDSSFIQTDLRAEMTEVFVNRKAKAGATASFTWNIIFAETTSANTNVISFYAGLGAIVGFANDVKSSIGGVFGFKGRLGVECSFKRHIAVSACLAPTIGMHVSRKNDVVNMRVYRNGLLYGLLPEVGIKYEF